MPSHSLALITIWTGPLPPYLRLFLLTAGANATVDFKFIADSPAPTDLPPNVDWVERSLPGLVETINARLDCEPHVRDGYKLIDFKPTFGVLFADLLEGYDFWGHLDCDMVLGDIRRFVTEDRLAAHDVLTFRGWGFTHGPLTIYRNDHAINRLFERAPDWKKTLADEDVHIFDETCYRYRIKGSHLPPAERLARGERVSMTDVVFDAADAGAIRLYDENHVIETMPAVFPVRIDYENGRLIDRGPIRERYEDQALYEEVQSEPREILYFHLLFAKKDPLFYVPSWPTLPERFRITRAGVLQRSNAAIASYASFYLRYFRALLTGPRRVLTQEVKRAARTYLPPSLVDSIRRAKSRLKGLLGALRPATNRDSRKEAPTELDKRTAINTAKSHSLRS